MNTTSRNRIDAACHELVHRLQSGQRQVAEVLLDSDPELSNDAEATIEVIYHEFVQLDRLGEAPSIDDYLFRFPQHEERLRRLLQIDRLLDTNQLDTDQPDDATHSDRDLIPADADADVAAAVLPTTIGRYQIEAEIGRGAMAVVYRAIQPATGRVVALKVLRSSGIDSRQRQRFLAESRTAAQLKHPGIVCVYEAGSDGEADFIAMEFVEGGTLQDHVACVWQAIEAATLIVQIAQAVAVAHQRGIIHRDLKPSNILLRVSDRFAVAESPNVRTEHNEPVLERRASLVPMVADFGLAKALADQSDDLTLTGDLVGTPLYMSPEQAEGRIADVGPASDVYALGVMLYQLLTGKTPFEGSAALQTLLQISLAEPTAPSRINREVPRDLETICLKCLEKKTTDRYATADLLAADLNRFLASSMIAARRVGLIRSLWRRAKRRPWLSGTCAALLLLSASVAMWSADQSAERNRLQAVAEANATETQLKTKEADQAHIETEEVKKRLLDTQRQADESAKKVDAVLNGARTTLRHFQSVGDGLRNQAGMDLQSQKAYEIALKNGSVSSV